MTVKSDPELVGIIETTQDLKNVRKQVRGLNQDLLDSGFNQYQFGVRTVGKKVYVIQEGV